MVEEDTFEENKQEHKKKGPSDIYFAHQVSLLSSEAYHALNNVWVLPGFDSHDKECRLCATSTKNIQ
jgi:hypothetical protein